jgi:hypothetical protein
MIHWPSYLYIYPSWTDILAYYTDRITDVTLAVLPPNAPDVQCGCGITRRCTDADHGMRCSALAAQTTLRHDILKGILRRAVHRAGIASTLEPALRRLPHRWPRVKSLYFNILGGKTNLAPSRSPKAYILLGARDPRNKVHPRLHQGIECNLTRSGISFCEHLNI